MTGLAKSGVFHFYCSIFSEVKGGSGDSAIGQASPLGSWRRRETLPDP